MKDLAEAYRKENMLPADAKLPADAVTRSASGLDPDISPANADLQVARVAQARHTDIASIQKFVNEHKEGRTFGLLGEPKVNILKLNLALDEGLRAK